MTVYQTQPRSRTERQVLDVARELVSAFGPEAWTVASMNMAECAAVGDQQSRVMWEAVTVAVDFLLQRAPAPKQALH